ncbi:HD domain-containing protein [Streptomyces sp. NPDC000888]
MRVRAKDLASEISRDLPEFTQHDVSHLDALWELADLVAGPELALNPAEGFVLGASILTHDLAMSRASHILAGGGIRARQEWPDALAAELRKEYARAPYPAELAAPPDALAAKAEKFLLRDLHASTAKALPSSSWNTQDGATAYLINDPEIRMAYGRLIGSIAASHHWDYDRVVEELSSSVGVPSFAPLNWSVDSLLLACLLRTADAAHLDASRAPDLLAAVREIPQESRDHWLFQSRLQRPFLKNDRLVFTASQGFSREEMNSWWLALETIRVVDEELRTAHLILLENGRSQLAARGVSNVDSPKSFKEVAPCRDWEPVAAEIAVTDVAGLVQRLGGKELYGAEWTVGLREVLTNACDAVRAREALAEYRGRPFRGRVHLWIEKVDNEIWFACNDNGIGMSPTVLGNQLLDFGCSSWLTPPVARDNPGLIASRFNPVGRFGIGFFSVFMMGDRVQVTSRSQSAGPADTWLLEFGQGVGSRPSLRKAIPEEQLDDPGTTVKVLLDPTVTNSAIYPQLDMKTKTRSITFSGPAQFADILRYVLPAPEVDIYASDSGYANLELIMRKNDWQELDGPELIHRTIGQHIAPRYSHDDSPMRNWVLKLAENLTVIHDADGRPVARATLISELNAMKLNDWLELSAVITAGPARTDSVVHGVVGLFVGTTSRAARDSARPLVDPSIVASWISEEAQRLCFSTECDPDWPGQVASAVLELGGDTGSWPFWRTKDGFLTQAQLTDWISRRDKVFVIHPVYADVRVGMKDMPANLLDGAVYFETGRRMAISPDVDWPLPISDFDEAGIPGAFLQALHNAWKLPDEYPLDFSVKRETVSKVSNFQGEDIEGDVQTFVRPNPLDS